MGERDVEYQEVDKQIAWKRRGKGKGLRWLMLRDIVALLARQASTTMQVQDVMILHRGVSHPRTHVLLMELEQARAIVQELDPRLGYYWTARELGVSVYLGSRTAIPAGAAQELLSSVNVNVDEESKKA